MKILVIVSGFFPGEKYGGPSVSIENFCNLMADNECYILTCNHDLGEKTPYEGIDEGWNKRNSAKVMYLSDKDINYKTLYRVAKELRPDVIYLQSLFEGIIISSLHIAKRLNIKVLLAPRGQLCEGAFDKRYKKVPFIWFLRLCGLLKGVKFQSTSDEETESIIRHLNVGKERIYFLTNIPSIPQTLPERKEKLKGKASFVFISRIVGKKNLLGAIRFFRAINGDVTFDIYGPKQNLGYWEECKKAVAELPNNIKVNYKGELRHSEVHKTLAGYDAFLFPTFSENYGHVIVEALFAGCIPIISDQTPWNDINDANIGKAIALDNSEEFEKTIQDVIEMNNSEISEIRKRIPSFLQHKLKVEQLRAEYVKALKNLKHEWGGVIL